MLISDEIYEAITYDGHRHISPASLSRPSCASAASCQQPSKTYAMTGWRVGYCAAPAPIIRSMLLVLQQSSRGPATFIQDAGAAALTGPQDCVARDAGRRTRDAGSMRLMPSAAFRHVDVLAPEGGFFAMLDVRRTGRSSDEVRRRLLHEHGVAVVHGAAYGTAAKARFASRSRAAAIR